MNRLNSLSEGEGVIAMLVACGPPAIEPLQRMLLTGRPSTIFQPRQWAVMALAQLDAKDALLAYLSFEREVPDAATRWGEDAVQSTAARALARWKTDNRVFDCLMTLLAGKHLQGAIYAIGEIGRADAIPILIRALGDDVARRSAEEALRKFGEVARDSLLETARTPDPSRRYESPSSVIRRRSALGLFSELPVRQVDFESVEPLIDDDDPELAVRAARFLVNSEFREKKLLALSRMIGLIPMADWLVQSEIEEALISNFDLLSFRIEREIEARSAGSEMSGRDDRVLRMFMKVRRIAVESSRDVA